MFRRTLLISSFVLMLSFVLLVFPPQNIGAATDTICNGYFLFPSDRTPDRLIRGPDGNLWFSEVFTSTPATQRIGTLTTNGIVDFPVPDAVREMTSGPDGNIWYITMYPATVVRITPQGTRTTFSIVGDTPMSIAAGSDGNLWVAEWSTNQIERVSTDGAVTGQFAIPASEAWPENLVLGPDNNLWFIEANTNKIGRVDMNGSITEFNLLPSSDVLQIFAMTSGADGNLWFSEYARLSDEPPNFYSSINKITVDGIITRFPKVPSYTIDDLTVGADGNVWGRVGSAGGHGIWVIRIAPDGSYTIFGPARVPWIWGSHIAALADGTIWMDSGLGIGLDSGFVNGLAYFDSHNIITTCKYDYFPFASR